MKKQFSCPTNVFIDIRMSLIVLGSHRSMSSITTTTLRSPTGPDLPDEFSELGLKLLRKNQLRIVGRTLLN